MLNLLINLSPTLTKVSGHYLLSGHFYLIVPSVTQTQNISKWIYPCFLVSQLFFPFVPCVPSCQDRKHINRVSSLITSPQTNQSPAHAIYSTKDSIIGIFSNWVSSTTNLDANYPASRLTAKTYFTHLHTRSQLSLLLLD